MAYSLEACGRISRLESLRSSIDDTYDGDFDWNTTCQQASSAQSSGMPTPRKPRTEAPSASANGMPSSRKTRAEAPRKRSTTGEYRSPRASRSTAGMQGLRTPRVSEAESAVTSSEIWCDDGVYSDVVDPRSLGFESQQSDSARDSELDPVVIDVADVFPDAVGRYLSRASDSSVLSTARFVPQDMGGDRDFGRSSISAKHGRHSNSHQRSIAAAYRSARSLLIEGACQNHARDIEFDVDQFDDDEESHIDGTSSINCDRSSARGSNTARSSSSVCLQDCGQSRDVPDPHGMFKAKGAKLDSSSTSRLPDASVETSGCVDAMSGRTSIPLLQLAPEAPARPLPAKKLYAANTSENDEVALVVERKCAKLTSTSPPDKNQNQNLARNDEVALVVERKCTKLTSTSPPDKNPNQNLTSTSPPDKNQNQNQRTRTAANTLSSFPESMAMARCTATWNLNSPRKKPQHLYTDSRSVPTHSSESKELSTPTSIPSGNACDSASSSCPRYKSTDEDDSKEQSTAAYSGSTAPSLTQELSLVTAAVEREKKPAFLRRFGSKRYSGNLTKKPIDFWDENDVLTWLSKLSKLPQGMEEVVRNNAINGRVLLSMKDEEWSMIEAPKYGYRRLLMLGAQELRKAWEQPETTAWTAWAWWTACLHTGRS